VKQKGATMISFGHRVPTEEEKDNIGRKRGITEALNALIKCRKSLPANSALRERYGVVFRAAESALAQDIKDGPTRSLG
jgi:hypothetical protein